MQSPAPAHIGLILALACGLVGCRTTDDPAPGARLARDLRDGPWPFDPYAVHTDAWNLANPTHDEFFTTTPAEDLWLSIRTTTDVTDFEFSVQHGLNSQVFVQVYRRQGILTTGPDALFADTVAPSWTWSSNPAVAAWQDGAIVIGSVYPGELSPRTYLLRVRSGPNIPGTQQFRARNFHYLAQEITI